MAVRLREKSGRLFDERNISYEYEEHKVKYTVPERQATYTPDFYVTTRSGKLIIIETKGRFVTADRQKMLLVKEQHPDLDIRFVFQIRIREFLKNQRRPTQHGARSTAFPMRPRLHQKDG